MKINFSLFFLLVSLVSPISIGAVEREDSDDESEISLQPDAIILKDEEPLKINPRLSSPQKNVNLRAVQKEVLSIALPEEGPEEVEERVPVEE